MPAVFPIPSTSQVSGMGIVHVSFRVQACMRTFVVVIRNFTKTMSDIKTNATVTLTVNGKQAQDMLDNLKKKSQDLEKGTETDEPPDYADRIGDCRCGKGIEEPG